ncbi:type I secretion system permease/ATPase [Inhella sp. 4Y17]|uniref:Type I secretion system permease/ATPase n=2 Tax=Inhella gelatinilytica TaxID=2795030 RepID=A0A931NDQ2_9BURK|nr:type I secretion system permease/ATPase [Inhella gelatinilytica]
MKATDGGTGVLRRSLQGFRKELIWVAVFSLFVNVLMLTPTLYMLQVFDRVMLSGSGWTLIALTLVTVLFFAVMAFSEWVRSRLLVRAGVRFDQFLNTRVFDASFEARLGGSSAKPLQAFGDLVMLRQYLTGNGVFAFFDTPWALIYIGVLFLMHPLLGWGAVVACIVLALVAVWSHRISAQRVEAANDATSGSTSFLVGKLRNAETIEALGMQGNLRRQWQAGYEAQLAQQGDAMHLQHRIQATVKFIQYTQQSLMLGLGAWLAVKGEIGVGAMVASNALASNAMRPIGTLVATWKQFIDARQSYHRLDALLVTHPPRGDEHAGQTVQGQISLRDLVATAPARKEPILKGLTADFKAGEVVGIVGPSGAGKSTLARCLLGIWPETQGTVLLDGQPIESWSREALGPHVGYLPQDIELFEGTIAENIARFAQMDPMKVIEAAQRTGIHEMVLRFPKGYDTPMGEAGGLLSGGQRQRIGLARALYGNPRLVVLDEPNANLDDVGETALIRAVRDLKAGGSTVFMIVHQQKVLVACDRVLVLQAGQIAQIAEVKVQTAPPAAPAGFANTLAGPGALKPAAG